MATYDVVIPSTGRPSLDALLRSLEQGDDGPRPSRVIVVDDRRDRSQAPLAAPGAAPQVEVVEGPRRGPAAARNAGWRRSTADWVAFLDDDVVTPSGWRAALERDLESLAPQVAASQGRIRVPLPSHRRPTDWERNVAGLERARWATADMAFRRIALEHVDGFDERFPRAYREDADLALRLMKAGWTLTQGRRTVVHPVRDAPPSMSLRLQAGNADDVLMRALHGPDWRRRAGAPPGRLRRHLLVTGAGALALLAGAAGAKRTAAASGALWLVGTAELARARIAPGPRTGREIATMLWTSALLPPASALGLCRGLARRPRLTARRPAPAPRPRPPAPPQAVLLDRDGTLVVDVPYNGDPAAVRPMPGARIALDRLRAADVRLAVVSNQSGIGRGLLSRADVDAVNERVEQLLGPLGPWLVCPHAPGEACECRKPQPGLVLRAAELLRVDPSRCAVIGDIGADVGAARAAGARGVLVPTARTRSQEVRAAGEVAPDLPAAVDLLLGASPGRSPL